MNKLICFLCLLMAGQLQGAIVLNGQLQAVNAIDITKAMGDNFTINVDGDSVVNIYYEDRNAQWAGPGFLEPAIQFNLNAQGSAVINFIIPENDTFSFYMNDETIGTII